MLMETPILGSEPLKGTRHPFVLHLVMNDPELCPITAPREVTGLDTRSSLTFPLGVIYEKGLFQNIPLRRQSVPIYAMLSQIGATKGYSNSG